ncbi:MAG: GNAT family N-acetyltransferase [Cyanosarcina radialis HA8281-LM2]|jgi:ribosomal protein S18 acetylase RimI-like enzyme|nr:GNAT family N-acetyltransferase [Cyanosarcina radialis HA8281-LM2]
MTEIELRSPTANELPLMRQLYNDMYEAIAAPAPPEDWVANVHKQSMSRERTYWFAFWNGDIVGFVDFKVMSFHPASQEKFARIFDLYVAPKFQRQGYGTQLARRAIAAATEQGARAIELNVLPNNQIALQFWQSLGFNLHLYCLQMSV